MRADHVKYQAECKIFRMFTLAVSPQLNYCIKQTQSEREAEKKIVNAMAVSAACRLACSRYCS